MTKLPAPPPSSGLTLRTLREQRGLTQQAFADKLGKSRTAVAAWEYGRSMSPRSRNLVAKFFGVEPDALGAPWNPHAARPQYRRRAREEAAYMAELRDLANVEVLGGDSTKVRVAPEGDDSVTSPAFPLTRPGGDHMHHVADPDLQKLLGFWQGLDAEGRRALLREGYRLADPDRGAHHARGKAHG